MSNHAHKENYDIGTKYMYVLKQKCVDNVTLSFLRLHSITLTIAFTWTFLVSSDLKGVYFSYNKCLFYV